MVSTLRALASALLGVEGADCWTIEDVEAKKDCPVQRHSQCDDKMDADKNSSGKQLTLAWPIHPPPGQAGPQGQPGLPGPSEPPGRS